MSAPKRLPETLASATAGHWLRSLSGGWPRAVCHWLERESAVVRVLVVELRGSTPREPGACMLVTKDGIEGTIGGGNLEWQSIDAARHLLDDGSACPVRLQRLVLGPELGQCCGGVVRLWLERFTRADVPLLHRAERAAGEGVPVLIATHLREASVVRRLCNAEMRPQCDEEKEMLAPTERRKVVLLQTAEHTTLLERIDEAAQPLWIYGAGHVGQALVRALAGLPFRVTWVDSRAEFLPKDLPDNVRAVHAYAPLETVRDAQPDAFYLVLTHDHALDYDLCRAILERGDFAWVGLIGSSSKGARFRSRLRREGMAQERIDRLVCPIGVAGIESKLPAAIAIGVVAQLLQQLSSKRTTQVTENRMTLPAAGHDCSAENCSSCRSHRRTQP